MTRNLTDNDYELLSAYIDEMLEDEERRTVETRLQIEPDLRREFAALRRTIALVQQLPVLRAPRNFMLTADMVESTAKSAAISAEQRQRIIVFPVLSALSAAAAMVMLVMGVSLLLSATSNNENLSRSSEPIVDVYSNTSPDDSIPPAEIAAAPTLETMEEAEMGTDAFMLVTPTVQPFPSPLPDVIEEAVEMEAPPAVMMTVPEQVTPTGRVAQDGVSDGEAPEPLGAAQAGAPLPAGTYNPPYKPTATDMFGTRPGSGGGGIVVPYDPEATSSLVPSQPQADTGFAIIATGSPLPTLPPTSVALAEGEADEFDDATNLNQRAQGDDNDTQEGAVLRERADDPAQTANETPLGFLLIVGGGVLFVASGLLLWFYRRQVSG